MCIQIIIRTLVILYAEQVSINQSAIQFLSSKYLSARSGTRYMECVITISCSSIIHYTHNEKLETYQTVCRCWWLRLPWSYHYSLDKRYPFYSNSCAFIALKSDSLVQVLLDICWIIEILYFRLSFFRILRYWDVGTEKTSNVPINGWTSCLWIYA